MRALPRPLALSAALLAGAVLVTGCATTGDSPSSPAAGDPPAAQTSSGTPDQPAGPAAPTGSTATADPTTTGTALLDRLMPTGTVPGLNARWRWQDGDTATASPQPFGLCAKADLLSIGASEAVERTYFPPDDSDDFAAEQVAEFPDANTAARAWAVLKSWHDGCSRKAAANPGLKVGPLTAVPVPAGSARWYLLSWRPAGDETGRFEAFGMVLDGTRLAVLRIVASGQHHTYPVGKEPIAAMATGAAGWLG